MRKERDDARLQASTRKAERDAARDEAARKAEDEAAMRKLAEQMAQQRKGMKVVKKKDDSGKKLHETSVDALATKDKAELMRELDEMNCAKRGGIDDWDARQVQ